MVGFSKYDQRARIGPGLLAIAPITAAVIALGLKKYWQAAAFGGPALWLILAYMMAILVQYRGKTLESKLWSSWGGRDTTKLLRTREPGGNPVLREQWRSALQAVSGVPLLDAAAETADPTLADQTIEAAIGPVLPLGRGHSEYPLVFADNIRYGFERNVWSIRWIGRGIALACVIALVAVLAAGPVRIGSTTIPTSAVVIGLVIDGIFLLGWLFFPSEPRTKFASDRYARGLLDAVVSESQKIAPTPPAKSQSRRRRS